ncbi:unnamed protein product [Acanthosepion pharaonis]|uniref:Uncharacterized protein n=1 Tax=Acanthosepion pharaonis TaxID=158019 RepID=A0A812AQK2_ACAPH|nr:unnamed protein product [Sepia pharaonis]
MINAFRQAIINDTISFFLSFCSSFSSTSSFFSPSSSSFFSHSFILLLLLLLHTNLLLSFLLLFLHPYPSLLLLLLLLLHTHLFLLHFSYSYDSSSHTSLPPLPSSSQLPLSPLFFIIFSSQSSLPSSSFSAFPSSSSSSFFFFTASSSFLFFSFLYIRIIFFFTLSSSSSLFFLSLHFSHYLLPSCSNFFHTLLFLLLYLTFSHTSYPFSPTKIFITTIFLIIPPKLSIITANILKSCNSPCHQEHHTLLHKPLAIIPAIKINTTASTSITSKLFNHYMHIVSSLCEYFTELARSY